MKTPLLSIVMPVYNGEYYLQEAIDSLLGQTFIDFELIIVDDGSTDKTKDILENLNDRRVQTIINKKNEGIVQSRNRGLAVARGKYYAPFDADDVAHPKKFEIQITFLEKHPEFSMIGSYALNMNAAGEVLPTSVRLPADPDSIPAILLFRNYFIQSSIVTRRDCLPASGYQQGFEIGEDWLMWIELSKKGKLWNLPEYLVFKRTHSNNAGSSDSQKLMSFDKKVYQKIFTDLAFPLDENQIRVLTDFKTRPIHYQSDDFQVIQSILVKIQQYSNEKCPLIQQPGFNIAVTNRWVKLIHHSDAPLLQKIKWMVRSPFFKTLLHHPFRVFSQ